MPERLFAPWRFEYVRKADGMNAGKDIFVDLPGRGDDRRNLILYRGRSAFVMMNAFPYTSGHLLVAPYRQVADITEMTDEELDETNRLVKKGVQWTRSVFRPDGYNIGVNMGRAAGAGIPNHIHWHVVPRWEGDTNFMGTVGDVRVIPQDLWETYDRLRAVVDADG